MYWDRYNRVVSYPTQEQFGKFTFGESHGGRQRRYNIPGSLETKKSIAFI